MHPAIRMYDERGLDNMSEESEKKNFIVKKSLQPVPSQGKVRLSRPKNMAASDPSEVTQETPQDPRQRGGRVSPGEGYN